MKSITRHPSQVIAREDADESVCYEILDILGEGGSGITYRARNSQTQQLVALKALSLQRIDDWKSIELFEREAKILAQLNHPAIPQYIDYFTVDTPIDRSFYIVQELALGETLDRLLARGWRATEAEVKDIATQLLEILIYLHTLPSPVIHRDIKPSNILRTTAGKIFLVDFGAVGQTYHNTFMRGSTVVGTFGYMAPEQFRSQAVPATDLYGLGATILNLLTNRSPADLTQADLQLKFRDKVQISPAFADWLEKSLAPDLVDRFDSAQTALKELKSAKRRISKSALPWRRISAFVATAIVCLGAIDYYKFYFLTLWGFTPMGAFTAIWKERDVNKVKSYLDRGVNPNAKDTNGSSLLHYAVTNNQVATAKLLIDRGVDVNERYGADKHTYLHLAVLHQDGEMTQALLDGKADPNMRDIYEYTPLHAAILRDRKLGYNRGYYGLANIDKEFVSFLSVKNLIDAGAATNAVGGLVVNYDESEIARDGIPTYQSQMNAGTVLGLLNGLIYELERRDINETGKFKVDRTKKLRINIDKSGLYQTKNLLIGYGAYNSTCDIKGSFCYLIASKEEKIHTNEYIQPGQKIGVVYYNKDFSVYPSNYSDGAKSVK